MPISNRANVARKQLFERYDALNSLWNKAEELLTSMHIPRPVSHTYYSYQPDERFGGEFCYCLGLQKIKGKWRLCHGTYYDQAEPFEPEDWTPIVDCSAEFRVKAAEHVGALRSALIESTENFIPEVDKAIAVLSKSVAAYEWAAQNRVIANGK